MKKLEHFLIFTMLTIGCACLHTGCTYDDFLSATKPCGAGAHWDFDFETGALTISGDGAVEGTPYVESMKPNIISVTVSEGITNIGDSVFLGCENIKSVYWNAKNCNRTRFYSSERVYDEFGHETYDENHNLLLNIIDPVESFIFGEQVEVIPARICASMKNITEINIPNSVTTIDREAFYYCENLTNVTIGNHVQTIGARAFRNCNYIPSITIPNSVTEIGDSAFYWCSHLKNVTIGDWVTNIGDAAFYNCTNLDSVTIGNSVTNIGANAFNRCDNLKTVTFPNTVKSIGERAFANCVSLTKVKTNSRHAFEYDYIGERAFLDCRSLTSFSIWGKIHRIETSTFRDCTNLAVIGIYSSYVDSIGAGAFSGCNLEKVYIYSENPPVLEGTNVFRRNDGAKIENLYVPSGSVNAYKESDWANYFVNILPK